MAINLVKRPSHYDIVIGPKTYSYWEDNKGTEILVYLKTGNAFEFLRRVYIPKK